MTAGAAAGLYGVAERIATITLNRPDVRNALDPEALELLGESIERPSTTATST